MNACIKDGRDKEVRGGKTIYTIYSRATGGQPLPRPSTPKIDPPDRFFSLRLTGSEVYRDEMTDAKTTDYARFSNLRAFALGGRSPAPNSTPRGQSSPAASRICDPRTIFVKKIDST